jgi:ATP-dependent exoDNAse (exonuclease V) beta subunit
MTDKEIMGTWEKKRDESASSGTFMHQQIEAFYNEEPYDTTLIPQEWRYFLRFHQSFSLLPYRTEWYVFDEDAKIAGSIDMTYKLAPDNDTDLVIVDWKRTVDLKLDNKYQKGLYPVHHLDDCNFIHYSLQLNIYKYILEKNYGKRIKALYLVVLHPSNDSFQQKEVPDMQKEVLQMLDEKKNPKTNRLCFLRR